MARTRHLRFLLVASLTALSACLDSGTSPVADPPMPKGRGIVALHSDDGTASISLLDRDGSIMKAGCFGSDTPGTANLTPLSADAVIPSRLGHDGPVAVIDRTNATLTWLDPATCAPQRQLALETGFKGTPRDLLELSPTRAYVTRWNDNPLPTAAIENLDDGSDVLVLDPSTGAMLGRIDLEPFAPVGFLPRPDRLLAAEDKVFVSLNTISADLATHGQSRVVVVDPASDRVTGVVDIPGAKSCGAMTYLPTRKLLVVCGGASHDGRGADASVVAAIDVAATPPTTVARIPASAVGGVAFSNASISAFDETTVLAVTTGNVSALPPDRIWVLRLDGRLPVRLFESTEGLVVGSAVADVENGRVYIAEGTKGNSRVHLYGYQDGSFRVIGSVYSHPSRTLPVRSLVLF